VTPRVISSLGPRSRETDETDETAAKTRARETDVIVRVLLVVSARLVVARPVVSRT